MELNDLVKLLEKASDPRRQAIEQAQAPKAAPKTAGDHSIIYIDDSEQTKFDWTIASSTPAAITATWTTTTADTNSSITTTANTSASLVLSILTALEGGLIV